MMFKHHKISWVMVLSAILVPSVILNLFFLTNRSTYEGGVPVIGVIDGDTIVLDGKTRVRLRYVDAPEKSLCGFDQATKELEKLALGKEVVIKEQIPDAYGRGMALVYRGDTLINEELLKTGWVRYHHDNSTQTDKMKKASTIAKEEQRGVYGACQSKTNTKNPTCVIKGNIDDNAPAASKKKYYLPGCAQYPYTVVELDMGEDWFCTEKAAQKAGFTKAETCK